MRPIKYRLLNEHRKIVGYEKWHKGNFNMETKKDYYVSEPLWLYSKDDKYWNPEIIRHRYKDQFTGLHDRNGLKEIYENDIIDIDGNLIGNIYENESLLEEKTNIVVTGMGTKAWKNTEQEINKRGCNYAK